MNVTLSELVEMFARIPAEIETAQHHAMTECGEVMQRTAKEFIGQERAAWAPLADATVASKQALGFGGQVSATDPLLRTGELRESIQVTVHSSTRVEVGSDLELAGWQENGTEKIPPRPFLSSSASQELPTCGAIIAKAVTRALAGLPTETTRTAEAGRPE